LAAAVEWTRGTVRPCAWSDFDFELPDELIAQQAARAWTSRLLVLHRGSGAVEHARIADIGRFLRRGDLLVVNDTRVFAARLLGRRVPSGGAVDCLLLSPPAAGRDGVVECDALMHPGQKLKPGAQVRFDGPAGSLVAEVLEREVLRPAASFRLSAEGRPDTAAIRGIDRRRRAHAAAALHQAARTSAADRERYQTMFAAQRGSVAAPTAGLHFTPQIVAALAEQGVGLATVTLHVGYGTFKPVRVERVEEHTVDPEAYDIANRGAPSTPRAPKGGA
jgi:S-adenosylmethionine:tRNA ribosyltransferase-isomerase